MQIDNILKSAGTKTDTLPGKITELLDGLDKLLVEENINPSKTINPYYIKE